MVGNWFNFRQFLDYLMNTNAQKKSTNAFYLIEEHRAVQNLFHRRKCLTFSAKNCPKSSDVYKCLRQN